MGLDSPISHSTWGCGTPEEAAVSLLRGIHVLEEILGDLLEETQPTPTTPTE